MKLKPETILDLERRVFHLQTLFETATALSNCRDSVSIYREILSILIGTFGVEFGFALRNTQERHWILVSQRGLDDGANSFARKLLTPRLSRMSTSARKKAFVDFFQFNLKADLVDTDCIWAEFTGREEVLGGIFLGRKLSGEPYSAPDKELIEAAASQVATALENLRLYEELKDAQERLQLENIALREEVGKEYEDGRIIGQSEPIREVLQQARNVAKSPTNVLIYGDTGTGKELLAKAIHYLSPRKDRPFVAVNCTAIPENLVESELFGIEAGVATGVKKHSGYFEQADGGTLFIDEIGDMPLSSQAKILRALQERCFRRVGGLKEISVDVRVIAATNKNLEREMKAGNFRDDLFFRLSVLELQMPPLRSRREDVPLLLNHFVTKIEEKIGKRIRGFSKKAINQLSEYDWPGNVRELENEIERAMTLAGEDAIIQPEDLSAKITSTPANLELPVALQAESLREAVDALETHLIKFALEKYHGNKSRVARKLGVSRLGLHKKMDRLGIRFEIQD